MPRNRVQHQKGLSDDAFERLYPDEGACCRAWFRAMHLLAQGKKGLSNISAVSAPAKAPGAVGAAIRPLSDRGSRNTLTLRTADT